jgi:hypothetical protein
MCSNIGQFLQNGHLPFELRINTHLVNYCLGSMHILFSVSATNGLALHLVSLDSQ